MTVTTLPAGSDNEFIPPPGQTLTTTKNRKTNVNTRTRIVVSGAAPSTPPPVVAPPVVTVPPSSLWTAPSSVDTGQLEQAISDQTKSVIELPPTVQLAKGFPGTEIPSCHIVDLDRSARPLLIRPVAGQVVAMLGTPGIYYDGQFAWRRSKGITMLGIEATGYTLSQTGFHNIDGATLLTLQTKLSLVTLSPTTDPWKTYIAYLSGGRSDLLDLDFEGDGVGNLWSGAQIASTTVPQGRIKIRLTARNLAFAFYEDCPTEALDLTATLVGTRDVVRGHAGLQRTGDAIRFHQANGLYRVPNPVDSGPVVVNASGMKAAA